MNTKQAKNLTDRLEDALPQTQCTKCGYPDCRGYAEALASGEAPPNRCPPGGIAGIVRLSQILTPIYPQDAYDLHPTIDPECGNERPRPVAFIDPQKCIGCTLCIQACPVDAIVGASKQMHVVLTEWCTGCDLCIPPCPVDCISMIDVTESKTGWDAWTSDQADISRKRYHDRELRLDREKKDNDARLARKAAAKLLAVNTEDALSEDAKKEQERKRAIIAAAIARAQIKK
ncbi:electron transport complex subunit RsxB [Polynucleobacter sp. AP-Latsch-80-C2]|jgi:electron transport complex protein RnfB|uniref:electron transport complex subunit RsxB n=1 Tax=Polynucleobacter sp. AP-Latsch-80-C2 TaxID=2576931 RepID=UPI001C0D7D1D|nr:electron transport complex subunit RsxB [Polynucleobacter sp. AP-Latsch-80-C2]MBU3623115.1 electron transport complex subunit RsxB [Polynucleobacter sp. AP-Latsch-80-C2]